MSSQIKVLSQEESGKLFNEISKSHSTPAQYKKTIRDATMFLLMIDAGLRVGEVCRLSRNCLCFANHFATSVHVPAYLSKNHTERHVPLTAELIIHIREMSKILWMPNETGLEDFAFYGSDRNRHLTTRQVQRLLEHYSLASLGFKVHPHSLRHTFATRLMKHVNIRLVQELLGHKHLSSTQVYTHPNSEDLKNAIDNLNHDRKRPC